MKNVHIITDKKGDLVAVVHGELSSTSTDKGPATAIGLMAGQKVTKVALDTDSAKLTPSALHQYVHKNLSRLLKK